MGKRFWVGLLLLSCVGAASAGRPGEVRKQVESSLLVNGTIDIQADGSVAGYTIEKSDTLAEGIVGMITRAVPLWRFEPIELDHGATRARARMSLRLVAKKTDDGSFSVQIRGTQFFGQPLPGASVVSIERVVPKYPMWAARNAVGGTVYTVVKVGRDGHVEDAVAEQVNLRIVSSEKDMEGWRDMLAKAALRAVGDWTFSPPTKGDEVGRSFWLVRVPVDFIPWNGRRTEDGQWQAYVPGPRQEIPWKSADRGEEGADAFAVGGEYPVGGGPRLLGGAGKTL